MISQYTLENILQEVYIANSSKIFSNVGLYHEILFNNCFVTQTIQQILLIAIIINHHFIENLLKQIY